jgi:hypothetical protein
LGPEGLEDPNGPEGLEVLNVLEARDSQAVRDTPAVLMAPVVPAVQVDSIFRSNTARMAFLYISICSYRPAYDLIHNDCNTCNCNMLV